MEGLLAFGLIIAALVGLDVAALLWGVDSREKTLDPRDAVWPAVIGTH